MNVEGVAEAKADWKKGWAWAKYDPSKTSPEKLVEAVNKNTAFEAKLPEKDLEKEKEEGLEVLRIDPSPCCYRMQASPRGRSDGRGTPR